MSTETIKRVRAYQARDGSLHASKYAAAIASIRSIADPGGINVGRTSIDEKVAKLITAKRKDIIAILQALDEPDTEPANPKGVIQADNLCAGQ